MIKLYHYTNYKALKNIVNDGGLKMGDVESFNDPYDCVLFQDENDYEKVHKLIKNYVVFFVLSDFSLRDYCFSKIKDRTIVGLVAKEIKVMQKFLAKQPVYTHMPILDRIGDSILNSGPIVKRQYEAEMKKWDEVVLNALNKTRANTLVTCFSKKNDSVLMWSHYADHHKGVCLEFDIEEDDGLKEVEYSKKLVGMKLYKMMSSILACDYLKRNNIDFVNNYKVDENTLKPFYTKSLDWKYENEVRYFYYRGDKNNKVQLADDKYIFKVGKPKAVYVGSKMTQKEIALIEEICRKNNINSCKTKLNDKVFKVDLASE